MNLVVDTLAYSALPAAAVETVSEATFIKAYTTSAPSRIIVWVKDLRTRRQRELEFDAELQRFLGRDERVQELPPPETFELTDMQLSVSRSFLLEDETDVLYERYAFMPPAADDHSESPVAMQIYYSKFKKSPRQLAQSALKKAAFPAKYARWTSAERANYWVGVLYRARRQAGESGAREDDAFDVDLRRAMLATDPAIEAILPECIASLARMEQVESSTLARVFSERTGLAVGREHR